MRIIRTCLIALALPAALLGSAVSLCAQTTAPAPADIHRALAIESLLHSTQNLYHTPRMPARAGRLVAIAGYVADLAPDDPRAWRVLSDVYFSQGRMADALAAAEKLRDAYPESFSVQMRWLRFSLASLDRADQRAALLRRVLDTSDASKAFRAEAGVELAKLYMAQGAPPDALTVLKTALALDPRNRTALLSRLELTESPSTALRVRTMRRLLEGNPRAWWIYLELAELWGAAGLHEQAVAYHRLAWELRRPDTPLRQAPPEIAADTLSALLDAGLAEQAVVLFAKPEGELKTHPEFQALYVEALRRAGKKDQADAALEKLEALYRKEFASSSVRDEVTQTEQSARRAAARAMQLGWFYLLSAAHRPPLALQYAREARDKGAAGTAVDLLLGSAELENGQADGLARLVPLQEDYPLAALFTARHYYRTQQQDKGDAAVLTGLTGPRKDLAFRRLRDLAEEHALQIPPPEEAQVVVAALEEFDPAVKTMGLMPQEFFTVTLNAVQAAVGLCEPIRMDVTLQNTSEHNLPLGEWGLLEDRIGLQVVIQTPTQPLVFQSLPMLILPAPNTLSPGQSLHASARIDVGALGEFLARQPLGNETLRVEAILNPIQTDKGLDSGLPMVRRPTATVTRLGLLKKDPHTASAEEYNQAVARIETILRGEDVTSRFRAARQIAALLSWIRRVETKDASLPFAISQAADKRVLLGLMTQALRDPAPVVRAELVASLGYANLGGDILDRLGILIEDLNPLVRMRVIELVGASETPGKQRLIELFLRDGDPHVRRMAEAFRDALTTKDEPKTPTP